MITAQRVYNLLLKFYPPRYRKEFEAQMMQTFMDHYSDLKDSEGRAGMSFWFLTVTDEVRNIARQRLACGDGENHFLHWSVGKLVLAAVFLLPLFAFFCAFLVKMSLSLPHPHLSGIFVIVAMAAVAVILPGILSVTLSYALAETLLSIFPKRRQGPLKITCGPSRSS